MIMKRWLNAIWSLPLTCFSAWFIYLLLYKASYPLQTKDLTVFLGNFSDWILCFYCLLKPASRTLGIAAFVIGTNLLISYICGLTTANFPWQWLNNKRKNQKHRLILYLVNLRILKKAGEYLNGLSFLPGFFIIIMFREFIHIFSESQYIAFFHSETNTFLKYFTAYIALVIGDLFFYEMFHLFKSETQNLLGSPAFKGAVARDQSIYPYLKPQLFSLIKKNLAYRIIQMIGNTIIVEIIIKIPGLGWNLYTNILNTEDYQLAFYQTSIIIVFFSLIMWSIIEIGNLNISRRKS